MKNNFRFLQWMLTGLSLAGLNLKATAQTSYSQVVKVMANDGAASDYFGNAVAISADANTAIVGMPNDDTTIGGSNINNRGSAYIFTRSGNTWNRQAKLVASTGMANDYFGYSVAISADGNTAIIGAYLADPSVTNQGAAFIFSRIGNNWIQQTQLVASDAASNDYFGISVSISADGNTAIAGAYRDDLGAYTDQGSAYVFIRNGNTWAQQSKLVATDGAANDQFGRSVALSGDGNTVIAGAYYDDITASNQGSAYIFIRSGTTWTQQAQLVASDAAADDNFGMSVSLSNNGNTALIGAYTDDVNGNTNQGSAYIFSQSGTTWTQQAQLLAADGAANDMFGCSVSISADGSTALSGAYAHDVTTNSVTSTDQGSAYVFVRNTTINSWELQTALIASDGAASDNFGNSVSVSATGSTVLAGAYLDNINFTDQGAAYFFASQTILPLTFINFTAVKQANSNVLNWKVAQEKNTAFYTVERSIDGHHYYEIASVAFLSSTHASRMHSFIDATPIKGSNYYRIKMTEVDGKISYSEVRLLNFDSSIQTVLFPNPAKDKVVITGVEAGMDIQLTNAVGHKIFTQKVLSNTLSLPLRLLPSGLYLVQVYSSHGRLISNVRLMKE